MMAVHTHLTKAEITALIAPFDLGDVHGITPIADGTTNSIWRIDNETGRFVLTLYERTTDGLLDRLAFMDHLAIAGLPCPRPVPMKTGGWMVERDGKPAGLVTFLPGDWPRTVTIDHARKIGDMLAAMHMAADNFTRPVADPVPVTALPKRLFECGQIDVQGLANRIEHIIASFPAGLPECVVHLDLCPDNVLFEDGRISGMLDFEYAGRAPVALDLATCLLYWCAQKNGALNMALAATMLTAYDSRQHLRLDEWTALPVLLQTAASRWLIHRLWNRAHLPPSTLFTPKDPMHFARTLDWLDTQTLDMASGRDYWIA